MEKKLEEFTDEDKAMAVLDQGYDEHPADIPIMVANDDGVISEEEANKHWDKGGK